MAASREKEKMEISRRKFLKSGAVSLGAALVSGAFPRPLAPAEKEGPKTQAPLEKRTLGRTGLKVTVIGFGSFGFSNPGVLQRAVESGINLILTDRSYGNGQAEKAIGQVLSKIPRENVVVGTGWGVSQGVKKADLLASLDGSLQRLQTEYVDLLRAFMVGDPNILRLDEQFEAFEAAKKAGKARFYGVSAHGGNQLDVFETAVDSGKFDYVMGRYNFVEHERSGAFLKKLADKKVGFIGFKISAGKRQNEVEELRTSGLSLHAAAAKWALQNPHVTSILGMMRSFEAIEEYLKAAREKLTAREERMLRRYRKAFDSEYCRNCGTCQKRCPRGVAVADVMRYCMYYKYYGTPGEAVRLYRELPQQARASLCTDCPGYCTAYCPHGLRVRDNLVEADSLLA